MVGVWGVRRNSRLAKSAWGLQVKLAILNASLGYGYTTFGFCTGIYSRNDLMTDFLMPNKARRLLIMFSSVCA
jgi:hypothetical protein